MEKCLVCGEEFDGEVCPNCQPQASVEEDVKVESVEVDAAEGAEAEEEIPVIVPIEEVIAAETKKPAKKSEKQPKRKIKTEEWYKTCATVSTISLVIGILSFLVSSAIFAVFYFTTKAPVPVVPLIASALLPVFLLIATIASFVAFVAASKGEQMGKKSFSAILTVVFAFFIILSIFIFLSEIGPIVEPYLLPITNKKIYT